MIRRVQSALQQVHTHAHTYTTGDAHIQTHTGMSMCFTAHLAVGDVFAVDLEELLREGLFLLGGG